MQAFLKSILILAGILAGSWASADPTIFIGEWKGKGTYILRGHMTQCSGFDLAFDATSDTFTFNGGGRECDEHSETFYPVTMDYRDGNLYVGNMIVGHYDGNVLEAYFREPDGDSFRNWRMSMRREGRHLMYEESRTMDGETTPLISVSGLLILQDGQ